MRTAENDIVYKWMVDWLIEWMNWLTGGAGSIQSAVPGTVGGLSAPGGSARAGVTGRWRTSRWNSLPSATSFALQLRVGHRSTGSLYANVVIFLLHFIALQGRNSVVTSALLVKRC